MAVLRPADDRRHEPGPELYWSESWAFDFVDIAGGLGGWVRLTLLPNLGVAWYDGFLCGPGRQLLAVVDRGVPLPTSPRSLEIRTTGLWADHICETPHDHWTLGLEAFALGVDQPAELYGRQLGDRVPFGLDLEWEADGPVVLGAEGPLGDGDGVDPTVAYHQPCRVSGEILVGADAIDFDGIGSRDHHWGRRSGWDRAWFRLWARLDDGTRIVVSIIGDGPDLELAGSTVTASIDGHRAGVATWRVQVDDLGLPVAAEVDLSAPTAGGADDGVRVALQIDPVAVTPVEAVDVEGRISRAPRALCWIQTDDQRGGVGWAELNRPQR